MALHRGRKIWHYYENAGGRARVGLCSRRTEVLGAKPKGGMQMKDAEIERGRRRQKSRPNTIGNYIAAVVFNVIFLVILNKVPDWNISFLKSSYSDLLPVINVSLGVQLAGNFLLIFFHPLYLHHLGQAVFSGLSALVIWRIYQVFPFDLDQVLRSLSWFDTLLKVLIMVVFVATVIGGSINFYKFLRSVLFPRQEE